VPDTFNTTVFGNMRSMTQVTTHIQVRPLRQSVNGPELAVNFRYGDPVFVWARDEDRGMLELAHVHYPRLQTAINYEQLRAFEASYMQYSYDTPATVGVRSYRNPGGVISDPELVNWEGDTVQGLGVRPGVFERWRFVGVCVAVDPVKDMFPMITVCTQGPVIMLNVFSRSLRVGTDLFFREVHVAKDIQGGWNQRQINTVKTLVAWPPHPIVSLYERLTINAGLMAAAHMQTGQVGEVGDRHYGPYRIIQPIKPTSETWATFGYPKNLTVTDNMCVVGSVLDVEPTSSAEPSLRGGWPEGTSVYNGAENTPEGLSSVYHGYIRVNLRPTCGLMIDEAVATMSSQGFSANLDLP